MSRIDVGEALAMLEMAFNEPAGTLRSETARPDVSGWDSMGALMLIAELDDRFGINLTPEQSRNMMSIADILNLLRTNNVLAD